MIYHTTDSGNSWDSSEVDGAVTDIRFFSDSLGYAVGSNALIMKTTDGGHSWQREYAWPYQLEDSNVVFRGTYLLPGSRTLIVYGDGVLVRGSFDSPATSVPTLSPLSSPSLIRVLPTISTTSKRHIELYAQQPARRITIYNMLAGNVYERSVERSQWKQDKQVIEVSLGELPSGSYRVMVTTDEGEYSAPLVLLR